MEYNSDYAKYFPYISTRDYKQDAAFLSDWIGDILNPKIMDFGAGCGLHLKQLIRNQGALNYLGVELSEHMRRESYQRGVTNLVEGIEQVEDKDFTHIYSMYNVLNCIGPSLIANTLDQILNRLQSGGQFLFETWDAEGIDLDQLKETERSFEYQGCSHKLTCNPTGVNGNSLKLHYRIKKNGFTICESVQHIFLHPKKIFERLSSSHKKNISWRGGLINKSNKTSLSLIGLIH